MPKSKKRGGASSHRKKVKSRNEHLIGQMKRQQKALQDALKEQIEAIRKMSGETENNQINTSELVKLNTDGFVQSAENV